METPAQRCHRLIGALDDLAAQEAASLAADDIEAVIALQKRAAPLVQDLGERGPAVVDDVLRSRVSAWLVRRREIMDRLAVRIEEARGQLGQLNASRRRVAQVGPAYGRNEAATQRLRLVG
jgi:hypothetical protein